MVEGLHRPTRATVFIEGKNPQIIEEPYEVEDFNGEASHFVGLLREGATESPVMSLEDSASCALILDTIRPAFTLTPKAFEVLPSRWTETALSDSTDALFEQGGMPVAPPSLPHLGRRRARRHNLRERPPGRARPRDPGAGPLQSPGQAGACPPQLHGVRAARPFPVPLTQERGPRRSEGPCACNVYSAITRCGRARSA